MNFILRSQYSEHLRHKRNGFLWGLLIAFGLVASGSYGALKYQQFEGGFPFLAASLVPIEMVSEANVPQQSRRLQFDRLPISPERILKIELLGNRVTPLEDGLTVQDLARVRFELHRQLLDRELSGYSSFDFLSGEIEDSFVTITEQTSIPIGQKAAEFEFFLQEVGEIVLVPWSDVLKYIEQEYLITRDDLLSQGFQVEQFRVRQEDGDYWGELIFSVTPSETAGLLQP